MLWNVWGILISGLLTELRNVLTLCVRMQLVENPELTRAKHFLVLIVCL